MANKKIRVGIVGTGIGVRVHAPLFQLHPGFEVVSIASVHRGKLEELKKQFGMTNVYDDWKKMLEIESLDLVSVTSAPYLHHEMVIEAYKHNIDVLCEKPMAMSTEQSLEMIYARKKSERFGFINFEFRFLPARMKVKEIVSSGMLGKINHVHYMCNYNSYLSSIRHNRGWLGKKEYGGGMLGAIGTHMLDSLLWWMDEDVKEVYGQLPIHVEEIDHAGDMEIRTADDSFQAIGFFKNKASFNIDLMTSSRQKANQWRLEIYGTEGTVIMTDDQRVEVAIGNEPLCEIELNNQLELPEEMNKEIGFFYPCFYPLLNQIHEALTIKKLTPILPTFENGHNVQQLLDAIRQSASEGKKVIL